MASPYPLSLTALLSLALIIAMVVACVSFAITVSVAVYPEMHQSRVAAAWRPALICLTATAVSAALWYVVPVWLF
jgi:hypothetical protein